MKLRGLRQVRQRSGLSISQLAELTGLRRETITHLEQGKEEPQTYALRRLAAALNTSTAEIVGIAVFEPAAPAPHIAPPVTIERPTAAAS
jgi:transcriptional regulator with XRE-family HTH domain